MKTIRINHLQNNLPQLVALVKSILMLGLVSYTLTAQDIEAIFQKAATLPNAEREAFIDKEIKAHFTEKRLEEFSAKVEEVYAPFFKKMGLSDEDSTRFRTLRIDLLRLAIEDGDPRQEFFHQRHAYDLDVRDAIETELIAQLDQHPLTKRAPHTVQVSCWSEDKDSDYASLYSQLGLSDALIEQFKVKRRSLHKMSQALTGPRETLIKARETYLKELKEVAGEKAYKDYERWERTKQAKRVYELFKRRTTDINMGLLKENEVSVVDLFREANVPLSQDWQCPFGVLPSPMGSQKLMGLQAQTDLPKLKKSREVFFATAESYQLPAPLLLELHGFFMEELNHLQVQIDSGKDPEVKIKFGVFE